MKYTRMPPFRRRTTATPAVADPTTSAVIKMLREQVAQLQADRADLLHVNRGLRERLADLSSGMPPSPALADPSVFRPDSRVECARLRRNLATLEQERDDARTEVEKLRAAVEGQPSGRRTWPGIGGRL